MSCCEKREIIRVMGKCSDMCHVMFPDGTESEGMGVPKDINIGSGDYLDFDYCRNCGTMVGDFPVEIPKKEE